MFNLVQTSVYEVISHGKYLDQDCLNVWHFSGAADDAWVGAPTSQDLLTVVYAGLAADIHPVLSERVAVPRLTVKRVSGWKTDGLIPPRQGFMYDLFDEKFDANSTGDLDGNTLPSYVAASCRKKTSQVGRRWVGASRFYGITEAQTQDEIDGNYFTELAHGLFAAAWDAFANAPFVLAGNDHAYLGVLSLREMIALNPVAGPVANVSLSWRRVTSAPVNPYLGSQVSRKVGHGS